MTSTCGSAPSRQGEDVDLTIEGWVRRPVAGPRLAPIFSAEAEVDADEIADEWTADAELRLTAISPELAERLGADQESAIGQPLTRLFQLVPDDDGDMPLIAALAARRDFSGQRAVARQDDLAKVTLSGQVLTTEAGDFAGFSGHLSFDAAPRECRADRAAGAGRDSRPVARRGAAHAARPDHRLRRQDRRARRRAAAQRLCRLRQRHRRRRRATCSRSSVRWARAGSSSTTASTLPR